MICGRGRGTVAALLLLTAAAYAQEPAMDPEITAVRGDFEYGKYPQVLVRAQERIDRGGLRDEELVELHKYAGLAALNLNQPAEAERHFTALLRLDPDFTLDPFVYPPAAINFFEKLRSKLGPELDAYRLRRRQQAERIKRDAEERERARRETEEQRRRLEELSRKITVRTVEKRSFLVNFVPFGAGQFQQGRTTLGLLLASVEAALAVASFIGYFAEYQLYTCESNSLPGFQTPSGSANVTVCGIPAESALQLQIWRTVKVSAGIGFYALYAYGVIDALYHHEDQVVTTQTLDAPPPPAPPAKDAAPTPVKQAPRFSLFLVPGGAGAGLTLHF